MAESGTIQSDLSTDGRSGGGSPAELSVLNALPYFAPVAIFPFVAAAALYGGWWLAGPFVFLWLTDQFDTALGTDEKNFDPKQPARQLFPFKLAVWLWVALYPLTFIFAFRQVFVADYLAFWEDILIVLSLGAMARLTLNAGHDMMHRRTVWERRIGEFLMASVSFPQEITEHIYVHHAHIGTPKDAVSAPKGQSFWQYLPRSVGRSYMDTWRVERYRLARRNLPVWHYTNPVWRYILETVAWYALAYWIGGVGGLLVLAAICAMGIFQLRMVDYMQHYGLQRIRLPGGRYERVQRRHSWSIAYKLSNWLYYNAQRHADHHITASRLYPLLRHSGPEEAPQLPGSYSAMGNLIMFPKRWFQKIDPLVDQWRAHFYPEIEDWSTYDSVAYRACPDAFEAIDEIISAAPRLAAWMNRNPRLLDGLQSREFTDLNLREGFGPDPEFETFARRGLVRVYWTYELDIAEMRARIADVPVRSIQETVETARDWSNDKVFQLCVHMIRGNLSPAEAGIALSNIAEASIEAVLSAVNEDFSQRRYRASGIAAAMLGDLASGDAVVGTELDVMFLYEGESNEHQDALFRRFQEVLHELSKNNLLFSRLSSREPIAIRSFADFTENLKTEFSGERMLDLIKVRRIFTDDESGIGERFDEARLDILSDDTELSAAIAGLGAVPMGSAEPGLLSIDDAGGGYRDVERAARLLQLTHATAAHGILAPDTVSVFRTAGEHGLVPADVAERLAKATTLWRNLRGILQLIVDDGWSIETASSTSKLVLARACDTHDFDGLTDTIRDTATRAASDIKLLIG